MSKTKIIQDLRDQGMTEAQAHDAYTAVVGAITRTVRREGEARLPDIGTFKRKTLAARTIRNPRTGEMTRTTEREALKFTASRNFAF